MPVWNPIGKPKSTFGKCKTQILCLVRKKPSLQKKKKNALKITGMKLKASFSKLVFDKKHGREMSYQTDPKYHSRVDCLEG